MNIYCIITPFDHLSGGLSLLDANHVLQFGEKWVKLHRGPMWHATRVDQNFDKS